MARRERERSEALSQSQGASEHTGPIQTLGETLPGMRPNAAAFASSRFATGLPLHPLADRLFRLKERSERAREYVRRHYADSSRENALASAVKHWFEYAVEDVGVAVIRPDCATLPTAQQDEEFELWNGFADFLFHDKGLRANTIEGYLSVVRGWHIEEAGWAPCYNAARPNLCLPRQLTGYYRERPKQAPVRHAHSTKLFASFRAELEPFLDALNISSFKPGVEACPQALRLRLEHFRLQLSIRNLWDKFMVCCALELQVCCLSRPGELYGPNLRFTMDDVQFDFKNGKLVSGLARVIPLKKRARSMEYMKKVDIPLVMDQGPNLQALRLCATLALLNSVDGHFGPTIPFFTFPVGSPRAGKPLRPTMVKKLYTAMLTAAGEPNPALFDYCHVPRIIGATTLAAAGIGSAGLKAMGRWAGDIAFIYARATRSLLERAQRALGSVDAGDLCSELLKSALVNGVDLSDDEAAEFDDDGLDEEA